MNRQEEFKMLKQEYRKTEVPDAALEAVKKGIRQAKEENQKESNIVMMKNRKTGKTGKKKSWKPAAALAAAALMGLLIVPNMNPQIAMAVSDVPVLNKVIELVTIDRFQKDAAENMYHANVATPEFDATGDAQLQSSIGEINDEVRAYADIMIAQFEQEMAQQGGVYGLDITYNVVTDTDEWFALQIITTETMAGGAETRHYYNLNKADGKYVSLAELFPDGADYVTAISEDIRMQMAERMKADETAVYNLDCELPEDNFQQIAADQNFYMNQDEQLVIAFDEYEVAPGFMGSPEFIIDEAVWTSLQKQ